MRRIAIAPFFLMIAGLSPASAEAPGELLRRELDAGRAAAAITQLQPLADASPDARMALGFAQFVRATERLTEGLFRFGLKTPQNRSLPIVRLPIPTNPQPDPVDYTKLRTLYQNFLDDLSIARASLAAFAASSGSDQSKLVLDLNAIRMSIASDVARPATLELRELAATFTARRQPAPANGTQAPVESWEVAFDRADALWIAGYSHILSALFEFVLAHDWQQTFDATGALFFAGAPPNKNLASSDPMATTNVKGVGFADKFALLHLIQWPAGDKTRMNRVRQHLKSAIALSRETWKAVLAETDDDREWLPSPTQAMRAIPSLPISDEMVTRWLAALDDFDALLDGQKLLSHWRFSNKGIDLRMFFEEPQPFDLVLWATGHGAIPFLKDGPTLPGANLAALERSLWRAVPWLRVLDPLKRRFGM
jgi:hypothetical protein